MRIESTFLLYLNHHASFMALICSGNYKQIWCYHGHQHSRHYQLWHRISGNSLFVITCKFCVEDLFILLPDLLLVVFKQPLAQVAHLLQCKRRLVLSWGTWQAETQMICKDVEQGPQRILSKPECVCIRPRFHDNGARKIGLNTETKEGPKILKFAFQTKNQWFIFVKVQPMTEQHKQRQQEDVDWEPYGMR